MMYLRALRPLTGDYGTVQEGQVFRVEQDRQANQLLRRGVAAKLGTNPAAYRETKVLSPPETKAVIPKGQAPLVSAIMPTADRRRFVPGAVRNFLEQTYPNKELVIIDDGRKAIDNALPQSDLIRYYRYNYAERRTIGAKRNLACDFARGEYIVHWDDDDRSTPDRIEKQIDLIQSTHIAVTGYHSIRLWDEDSRQGYRYTGDSAFATGTSLCYKKAWWQQHRFVDQQSGEDSDFVRRAAGHLISVDGSDMIVARLHSRGTSPKPIGEKEFTLLQFQLPVWAAL